MEGGEWSNFNTTVCVNEEADFMAQLFPISNEVEVHYDHNNNNNNNNESSDYNSNTNTITNGSSYYSSDSSNNSNYYHHQQTTSSFRNPHVVGYYQMDYLSHTQHTNEDSNVHHDPLAAAPATSNASALPIDFLQGHVEDNGDVANATPVLEDTTVDVAVEEDKSSDSTDNLKKRSRPLDVVPRGKRNVRAKKNQKLTLGGDNDEEENEVPVNGHSSSSGSLEDDCSSKGATAALNSSGKTRASRGSATDPQSLYARKRRERINERLRILQGLVPNGTKVDISTMLEEAVHYVKFLQLQIKLLSSDEMWMYAPIAYNGMSIGLDFNNLNFHR